MLGRLSRKLLTSGTCLIMLFGVIVPACESGGPGDDPCSRCPPNPDGKALIAQLTPEVKAGLADIGFVVSYKGVKQVIGRLDASKATVRDKAARMLADAWVLLMAKQPGTKLEGLVRDEMTRRGFDVDAIVAAVRSG